MANEDIGTIACPFTGERAKVRRARQGKFPLYVYTRIAGPVFMKTPEGQDWILEHAHLYGPEGGPEPVTEPEPEPVTETEEKPKRKAFEFLDDL